MAVENAEAEVEANAFDEESASQVGEILRAQAITRMTNINPEDKARLVGAVAGEDKEEPGEEEKEEPGEEEKEEPGEEEKEEPGEEEPGEEEKEEPGEEEKAAGEDKEEDDKEEVPERTWQSVVKVNKQARALKTENKSLQEEISQLKTAGVDAGRHQEVEQFIESFNGDKIGLVYNLLGGDQGAFALLGERFLNGGSPGQQGEMAQLKSQVAGLQQQRTSDVDETRQAAMDNAAAAYGADIAHAAKEAKLGTLFTTRKGVELAIDIAAAHFATTGETLRAEDVAVAAHKQIVAEVEEEMTTLGYEKVKSKDKGDKPPSKKTLEKKHNKQKATPRPLTMPSDRVRRDRMEAALRANPIG